MTRSTAMGNVAWERLDHTEDPAILWAQVRLTRRDPHMPRLSYDGGWRACGARRIDEPEVMEQVIAEIAGLWELAEPFWPYFHREIAPLTPSA